MMSEKSIVSKAKIPTQTGHILPKFIILPLRDLGNPHYKPFFASLAFPLFTLLSASPYTHTPSILQLQWNSFSPMASYSLAFIHESVPINFMKEVREEGRGRNENKLSWQHTQHSS